MEFLPSCVSTAVWIHYLDANKTQGEKVKREIHKDSTCCFEKKIPTKQQLYAFLPPISPNI